MNWLSFRTICVIHQQLIVEHGGAPGIRDSALIESTLARPLNKLSYENPSVFSLAASYGYGFIRNHCFVDGNKRVGLAALAVFLRRNGYQLIADETEAALIFQEVAAGDVTEEALAKWVEANSVQRS